MAPGALHEPEDRFDRGQARWIAGDKEIELPGFRLRLAADQRLLQVAHAARRHRRDLLSKPGRDGRALAGDEPMPGGGADAVAADVHRPLAMSAAKIAASLRSTRWTGTLGSSPSEYSEPRNRRTTRVTKRVKFLVKRLPLQVTWRATVIPIKSR
jgi:hypothetical protein